MPTTVGPAMPPSPRPAAPASPLRRRLPVLVLLALALGLALWRLIGRDAPLSVLLVALPALAAAAIPRDWYGGRGTRIALVVVVAIGMALPALEALLRTPDGMAPTPWPLLVKMWCGIGIVLAFAVAVARWSAAVRQPIVRTTGTVLIALVAMHLVMPLTKLYRHQYVPAGVADGFPAAAERFAVVGADGVVLRCFHVRAPEARGVVVFTHGIGAWAEFSPPHLEMALAAGWDVIAWDLRGHGRSSPAAVSYGVREADDLVAVWAAARVRAAGRPLVAYGASMGAAITLLAADRLDGCAGVAAESPFADLASLIGRALPPPVVTSARLLARCLGWNADRVRPIEAAILRRGPPLLIGWCGADQVIPADHGERLAAAAPRARTLALPDGGHMDLIHHEPWRDAVLDLLRAAAGATSWDGGGSTLGGDAPPR